MRIQADCKEALSLSELLQNGHYCLCTIAPYAYVEAGRQGPLELVIGASEEKSYSRKSIIRTSVIQMNQLSEHQKCVQLSEHFTYPNTH